MYEIFKELEKINKFRLNSDLDEIHLTCNGTIVWLSLEKKQISPAIRLSDEHLYSRLKDMIETADNISQVIQLLEG